MSDTADARYTPSLNISQPISIDRNERDRKREYAMRRRMKFCNHSRIDIATKRLKTTNMKTVTNSTSMLMAHPFITPRIQRQGIYFQYIIDLAESQVVYIG